MNDTTFIFERERSLGQLIRDTFLFFRLNKKQLGFSLLVLVLPFSLASGYFYAHLQYAVMINPTATPSTTTSVLYYLSVLCTQAMLIATSNSYIVLYHKNKGSFFSFKDLEQFALSRFFNHVFTFIGVFFILLIGLLLFIIPGIWATMPLMLLFFVMLFERQPFHVSVQRSFLLVKDYWWQTFGRMLAMWGLSILLGAIFILPELFATIAIKYPDSFPQFTSNSETLFIVVVTICQGFFTLLSSLIYIAAALQYFHLAKIKTGKAPDFSS